MIVLDQSRFSRGSLERQINPDEISERSFSIATVSITFVDRMHAQSFFVMDMRVQSYASRSGLSWLVPEAATKRTTFVTETHLRGPTGR